MIKLVDLLRENIGSNIINDAKTLSKEDFLKKYSAEKEEFRTYDRGFFNHFVFSMAHGYISINNNQATTVTFNSELYDTNSMHSTTSNTERINIKSSGYYMIIGQCRFEYGSAVGCRTMTIFDSDGNAICNGEIQASPAGHVTSFTASQVYFLTSGKYVYMRVYQDSGGALDLRGGANETFMTVALLS